LGLGIVNFEMDNYSAGEKYILDFRDIYRPEYREIQSRAIMVCFAGLFLPAVMFLDIIFINRISSLSGQCEKKIEIEKEGYLHSMENGKQDY